MAISPEFRKEITEMTEELEEISSEEAHSQALSYKSSDTPDFSAIVESDSGAGKITKINVFNRRVLIPVMAAAAAVLLFFILPSGPSEFELRQASIETELLISLGVRDGDAAATEDALYESAEEAALGAFRSMLVFEVFRLHPDPDFISVPATDPCYEIKIEIETSDGQTISDGSICQSHDPSQLSDHPQVWLLLVGSRSLYSVQLKPDSETLRLPDDVAGAFCVAVVVQTDRGFESFPVGTSFLD